MSVDPESDTQPTQRSDNIPDHQDNVDILTINEIPKERPKKNGFIPRDVTPNRQDGVRKAETTPLRGEMDSLSPLAQSRNFLI